MLPSNSRSTSSSYRLAITRAYCRPRRSGCLVRYPLLVKLLWDCKASCSYPHPVASIAAGSGDWSLYCFGGWSLYDQLWLCDILDDGVQHLLYPNCSAHCSHSNVACSSAWVYKRLCAHTNIAIPRSIYQGVWFSPFLGNVTSYVVKLAQLVNLGSFLIWKFFGWDFKSC